MSTHIYEFSHIVIYNTCGKYTWRYTHSHLCLYVCMYIHIHEYAHTLVKYKCIHRHKHTCMQYIHLYINTWIFTYMKRDGHMCLYINACKQKTCIGWHVSICIMGMWIFQKMQFCQQLSSSLPLCVPHNSAVRVA